MRISKLQKHILECGYKDVSVMKRHFKTYYGLPDENRSWHGQGMTNAQRVTKLRCKRNMIKNGLLELREGYLLLTERGIETLKANGSVIAGKNISFSEYQKRVEEYLKGAKAFVEQAKIIGQMMRRRR